MKDLKSLEVWFITGSQHLYGEETLKQVATHSQQIASSLDNAAPIPVKIVFKPVVKTAEEIYAICQEVNVSKNCAGIIAWMHTFSPAKMWIAGLKILQKPLLHLHTQFNRDIPWNEIDMDFMNLNQSAHGDREFGFMMSRMRMNRKVVVGHWQHPNVIDRINVWARAAAGWHDWQGARFVRFGDNMRNVAVTDGDKVEAEIKFGYSVNTYGIGDLVKVINEVSDKDVDHLVQEYADSYTLTDALLKGGEQHGSLRDAARIETGLKNFLEAGGFKGFTDTFEDLHGMKQLPGIAAQRLMGKGYGFAGEGDWKTAALDRLLKVMSHNQSTGFMEDYTYELAPGRESVLQSHMLEVDPTLAVNKPKLIVSPLGIGNREDPARLVFDGKQGEGVVVSMADFGTHYKLLINEVSAFEPEVPAPNLPVARVLWNIKPNFQDGVKAWIENGGGHHTVLSLNLTTDQIVSYAKLVDLEYVIIK